MALDAQQIELVARAALEAELVKRGFEVARPHRDKGIDLLVFLDEADKPFAALPIQIKASTGTPFGVWRKYERMTGLVLAYVWNVLGSPRFFLMNYAEAARIIPKEQKETDSWKIKAGWRWPNTPKRIAERLLQFEDRWEWLREQLRRASRLD